MTFTMIGQPLPTRGGGGSCPVGMKKKRDGERTKRLRAAASIGMKLVIFIALLTASVLNLLVTMTAGKTEHEPIEETLFVPHVGVPADLVVHGKRAVYVPVPKTHRRRFYIHEGSKGYEDIVRAFRNRGWTLVQSPREAQVLYGSVFSTRSKGKRLAYYNKLQPWQRYSRVPGTNVIDSKDGFLVGFQRFKARNPSTSLYFLPRAFSLADESSKRDFLDELEHHGGMGRPWVLKEATKSRGRGIEMLGPNSKALMTAIDRVNENSNDTYIIQEYICNELVWHKGHKFDLRMYWMIASVDPLIVLYHDGYVRVSESLYDEADFSSTAKHLTNGKFRVEDESQSTKEALWTLVRNHYKTNRNSLSRIMIDPVQHVRNQIKEALGATVSAFRDVSFGNANLTVTAENLFGFYGCDFVIDNDLDVFYLESQSSPQFGVLQDHKVEMYREIFRSMVDVVEEISIKQEADTSANILPLAKLGGWEIVYAGDWQFTYEGYARSEDKAPCEGASAFRIGREKLMDYLQF